MVIVLEIYIYTHIYISHIYTRVANFAFASVGPACRHPLPRHQLVHLSCGRSACGASSSELGRRPSARTYVQLKTKTKQICQIETEGGLGPQFPEGRQVGVAGASLDGRVVLVGRTSHANCNPFDLSFLNPGKEDAMSPSPASQQILFAF